MSSSQKKSQLICKALVLLAGIFLFVCVPLVPTAHAIPYFARKYETSCSTCHNNFPELNDFGIVFKKNGFKFPKDEETYVKQPPVLLGRPRKSRFFPR